MSYDKKSVNPFYDQAAWEAIKRAEPFPAFPKEFKEDTIDIGFRFNPGE